ncbi:MAG: PAS domain S-box protein [Prolixibacteraceae bacterium]|nr:PAS domain S-box protein [Prolixibacteraceae bacterium]
MAKSKMGGDILVVDDTNDVSILLKRILEKADYSVVVADNGPEALDIATDNKPALILLDIMMPGMDGYEVCRKLKNQKRTRDIPILFISALDDRESILKGFEAGGTDYITKPFNQREVIARVNAQMNQARLQKLFKEKNKVLEHEIKAKEKINNTIASYEKRYRSIFEQNPTPMCICDKQTLAFIGVNKAATMQYGYSHEAFKAMHLTDICGKKELEKIFEREKNHDTPFFVQGMCRHKKKNGEPIYAEVALNQIDFKGNPAWLVTLNDVTERVLVQNRLKDSVQMFHGIFDNSPDAIFLVDPHSREVPWRITDCNKAACEMNGYTREELIGQSIDLLNDDDQTQEDHDNYLKILKKQGVIREETTHTRKDGHVVHLEILTTLVTLGGKEYVLGIDRDITKRKKIQAELIAAKEKAEENDRLKSAFLANMSHEIHTPLNSILGFSELLSEPEFHTSHEEAAEYAKMIITSGNNLLSIINDILDISKIESGEVRYNIHPFSPKKLIGEVCSLFKMKAGEKGINLQVEKDGFPATFYLNSDEGKLKQVLVNFVSNAIKFTNEGSITIGIEKKRGGVKFYVRDTGIGIPEKFHAHLFSRFRQAEDSTTRKYGGNGLGLAISKSLVELLGGTIGFESEPGKGATFFFDIPFGS